MNDIIDIRNHGGTFGGRMKKGIVGLKQIYSNRVANPNGASPGSYGSYLDSTHIQLLNADASGNNRKVDAAVGGTNVPYKSNFTPGNTMGVTKLKDLSLKANLAMKSLDIFNADKSLKKTLYFSNPKVDRVNITTDIRQDKAVITVCTDSYYSTYVVYILDYSTLTFSSTNVAFPKDISRWVIDSYGMLVGCLYGVVHVYNKNGGKYSEISTGHISLSWLTPIKNGSTFILSGFDSGTSQRVLSITTNGGGSITIRDSMIIDMSIPPDPTKYLSDLNEGYLILKRSQEMLMLEVQDDTFRLVYSKRGIQNFLQSSDSDEQYALPDIMAPGSYFYTYYVPTGFPNNVQVSKYQLL